MKEVFYAIGDFFGSIFEIIESMGNTLNYFYIGVIFVFLVVWAAKMIKHKKDGEEHASS
jgi:tellurite resistance protein TehA-like permease